MQESGAVTAALTPETLERVRARTWYHTLELAPGVTTDGWFDLRDQVRHYHLPERLDGLRCLEVGTWDGFWGFELERRGAAEVVALDLDDEADLDWPPRRRPSSFPEGRRGDGFRLAKEILGSKVQRVNCSIYDATPEELGTFDVVFCSAVLLHLRDQMLALERIADLCSDVFFFAEEYDRASGLVPFPVSRFRLERDQAVVFWLPAAKTWKRMVGQAGFDRVEDKGHFDMRAKDFTVRHLVLHAHKR
jgi:tRNA (mo5U34)-methyltransferase